MISLTQLNKKEVGVLGLAKAGQATVASLLAGGAKVIAWDDKPESRAAIAKNFPQAKLAEVLSWPWEMLDYLVPSPGVPLTHPVPHPAVVLAAQNNVPIIGDIDLLHAACPSANYIGITGTNGKSTTTALIGHILQQVGKKPEVGGNLGTPALSLLPLGKEGIYVLELSSYQLDLMNRSRINISILLNITPDHLDRHGDMAGYIAAKKRIFHRQTANDTAVIAIDDEYTSTIASELKNSSKVKLIPVSTGQEVKDGVYVQQGVLNDVIGENQAQTFDLARHVPLLPGRHNWQNIAAAYAACRACGLNSASITQAISTFPGLRHRLQFVTEVDGVRFINDSKATNADATSHALAAFDQIYWIAGGQPKSGGIAGLENYFPRILHAFLIGEAEEQFARTLDGKVNFSRCGNLAIAFQQAAAMARKQGKSGAVVLLSPACASWDQWPNFEARGDVFCRMAEELTGVAHAV